VTWAVAVHGGAKTIAPHQEDANRAGCLAALSSARAVLEAGGSALDAVEAAIRVLESDPTFNAGVGSVRDAEGNVTMDAAIMDGSTLDVGAVAAITGVRNPVSVARLLLRETPILLVGEGAVRFAASRGAELCDHPSEPSDSGHDTVGCVALDVMGRLAAGTSTGGLDGTLPGRVGDSPLPGCGFFADNTIGAVALSGDGENIARMAIASRIMRELEASGAQDAAERGIAALHRIGGEAGAITVSPAGHLGWAHNSSHFAVAWATSSEAGSHVSLRRGERAVAE
jgi:beta-aspartyl-peptidase (threonine type)